LPAQKKPRRSLSTAWRNQGSMSRARRWYTTRAPSRVASSSRSQACWLACRGRAGGHAYGDVSRREAGPGRCTGESRSHGLQHLRRASDGGHCTLGKIHVQARRVSKTLQDGPDSVELIMFSSSKP
jgi:hypothetical protein